MTREAWWVGPNAHSSSASHSDSTITKHASPLGGEDSDRPRTHNIHPQVQVLEAQATCPCGDNTLVVSVDADVTEHSECTERRK